MKKRIVITVAALLILVSIILPISETRAAMMDASGYCYISHTGKTVTFSGYTVSTDDEDIIRVTITLQEKRDGTWYGITSRTKTEQNSDLASTTKDYTVSGGHYYRTVANHYYKTGNTSRSFSTHTNSVWIPE